MKEPSPSQRELEILKVLWELGEASVREVREQMCPNNELAFNTVQTLLRIMDEKGLVKHRRVGRAFLYTPNRSRERVASSFLERVFDGALDQMVLTLLRAKQPNAEELKYLEGLIAKARRQKQGGRKRGK